MLGLPMEGFVQQKLTERQIKTIKPVHFFKNPTFSTQSYSLYFLSNCRISTFACIPSATRRPDSISPVSIYNPQSPITIRQSLVSQLMCPMSLRVTSNPSGPPMQLQAIRLASLLRLVSLSTVTAFILRFKYLDQVYIYSGSVRTQGGLQMMISGRRRVLLVREVHTCIMDRLY